MKDVGTLSCGINPRLGETTPQNLTTHTVGEYRDSYPLEVQNHNTMYKVKSPRDCAVYVCPIHAYAVHPASIIGLC